MTPELFQYLAATYGLTISFKGCKFDDHPAIEMKMIHRGNSQRRIVPADFTENEIIELATKFVADSINNTYTSMEVIEDV